jgi:hypothetical protein
VIVTVFGAPAAVYSCVFAVVVPPAFPPKYNAALAGAEFALAPCSFPVAKFVSVVQDDPSYNSVAVKDPGGPNPPNPKADV